jgi:hypothetical protein
MPQLLTSYTM